MAFKILALIVMIGNFYFAFSEIFLWEKSRVRRTFGLSVDFAARTKKFALSIGVSRILLGTGFVFGFVYVYANEAVGTNILIYCMICSLISSIILSVSFNIKFFLLQGIPAIIALFLIF